MLKWSPVWPVTASSSWLCVLLTPLFSSPFLLSGRKTVSGSSCSVSASVPESAVSSGSHSAFEWKVTFRSKDRDTGCSIAQDTGCSIASERPFSQTLCLGRGGKHACVHVRNSHVQPRVSLFLPVPRRPRVHTDTSDLAAAPPGHRSLVPLHVCTFVPRQEEAGVCYSCLLNCSVAPYLADPWPRWTASLSPPHSALLMRGSAPPMSPPMPGRLAAFPPGRKTPDLHPSPSSRPSCSLSDRTGFSPISSSPRASCMADTLVCVTGQPGSSPLGEAFQLPRLFFVCGIVLTLAPQVGRGSRAFWGRCRPAQGRLAGERVFPGRLPACLSPPRSPSHVVSGVSPGLLPLPLRQSRAPKTEKSPRLKSWLRHLPAEPQSSHL